MNGKASMELKKALDKCEPLEGSPHIMVTDDMDVLKIAIRSEKHSGILWDRSVDSEILEAAKLIDTLFLSSSYSHEFFPKISEGRVFFGENSFGGEYCGIDPLIDDLNFISSSLSDSFESYSNIRGFMHSKLRVGSGYHVDAVNVVRFMATYAGTKGTRIVTDKISDEDYNQVTPPSPFPDESYILDKYNVVELGLGQVFFMKSNDICKKLGIQSPVHASVGIKDGYKRCFIGADFNSPILRVL